MHTHTLIKNWRRFSFDEYPYLYPPDKEYWDNILCDLGPRYRSFRKYIENDAFDQKEIGKFHFGLSPSPYEGNLAKAKIYILLLNPGIHAVDYYVNNRANIRRLALKTIHQKDIDREYPFTSLNPKNSWRRLYWFKKLSGIAQVIKQDRSWTYSEALQELSRSIAILQLVPYHSKTFNNNNLKRLKKLPSVQHVREYVHDIILPKATKGRAVVIVTRAVDDWGLKNGRNICIYEESQSRGAHIGPTSDAGKKILKMLLNK